VVKKATKKSTPGAQGPDFEAALEELENLVELMEAGDISLEESLKHFERGIALTRQCQQALQQAEQKVRILLNDNGETEAFDTLDSDEISDNESAPQA